MHAIAAWLEVSPITSFIYELVMLTHISYHTLHGSKFVSSFWKSDFPPL